MTGAPFDPTLLILAAFVAACIVATVWGRLSGLDWGLIVGLLLMAASAAIALFALWALWIAVAFLATA